MARGPAQCPELMSGGDGVLLEQVKKKVLLLGDAAVGKTSLIRRFVVDKFSDDYITTIGTKVTKKELRLPNRGQEVDLTLMIWDVLGQKAYRTVHRTGFSGAAGAILVADLTRPETLDSLELYWIPRLRKNAGMVPLVFAGNKKDLLEFPRESVEVIESIARKFDSSGLMTSAKTGEGVEAAFNALGSALLAGGEATPVEGEDLSYVAESPALMVVADGIMTDFCREFGGLEAGMPVVRKQFAAAGVHVNDPTEEELKRAVELLAEVERSFRDPRMVRRNRERRLAMIRKALT